MKRAYQSTPAIPSPISSLGIDFEDNSEHKINILSIVQNMLYNNNTNIDEKTFEIIHQIITKSPETFIEINNAIENIFEDRTVYICDIPQIILIIFTVLKNNNQLASEKQKSLDAIYFIIISIIDSGVISFSDYEITKVKIMVDSSVALLEENLCENTSTPQGWFDCCTR